MTNIFEALSERALRETQPFAGMGLDAHEPAWAECNRLGDRARQARMAWTAAWDAWKESHLGLAWVDAVAQGLEARAAHRAWEARHDSLMGLYKVRQVVRNLGWGWC